MLLEIGVYCTRIPDIVAYIGNIRNTVTDIIGSKSYQIPQNTYDIHDMCRCWLIFKTMIYI